jgi:beta-galactosidase
VRFRMIVWLMFCFALSGQAQSRTGAAFGVDGDHFVLNGKPFQVISGEMHYPRIPRAYWRERFRMAKSMGLNTITTYVFWNEHEPKSGVYDFSGNEDVAELCVKRSRKGST